MQETSEVSSLAMAKVVCPWAGTGVLGKCTEELVSSDGNLLSCKCLQEDQMS